MDDNETEPIKNIKKTLKPLLNMEEFRKFVPRNERKPRDMRLKDYYRISL
jgi:hypothetical protein